MNLLQVSPQHQKNSTRDYLKRRDPVYVSRVVSAMVGPDSQRGESLTGSHHVAMRDLLWLEGDTADLVNTPAGCHVES